MSMARVYSLKVSITSGARYHLREKMKLDGKRRREGQATDLVATYSVMKVLLSFATLGGGRADRARPKSQI